MYTQLNEQDLEIIRANVTRSLEAMHYEQVLQRVAASSDSSNPEDIAQIDAMLIRIQRRINAVTTHEVDDA